MIEIPQPSIALNSHDVPGTKYQMWKTWDVPENYYAENIVSNIQVLGGDAEEPLKCLVINCHGDYDKGKNIIGNEKSYRTGGFGLSLGKGINLEDVKEFNYLRGLFKCIVIVACGAAYTTVPGKDGDGALLCAELAKASGAYVVAPKTVQIETNRALPKNHIDNFEGVIVRYNPAGGLDSSGLLGRKLIKDVFKDD